MNPNEGPAGVAGDHDPVPGELSEGQRIGAGRFTLVRLLGRGGMGVVWLARDGQLGEEVALKMLPPEIRSDPVALDDLRRETLKSRKLTHPNIIRIHDLCHPEGEGAFISMEYVDGPNLVTLRLERPGRFLTWDYLKPLARQLCDALEYAHGEKVIHRDLKPGNMMLDGRGRLKLADFGIAATASDSASRMSSRHTTSGTPSYMSPQQMEGQMPRAADDIYSFGATLYELLTSSPPFYTGDISYQVKNLPAQPIAARLADVGLANEIPAEVTALVMACLAKDPAQRPQSMREVAEWIGFEKAAGPPLSRTAAAALDQDPEPEPGVLVSTSDSPTAKAGHKMWAWLLAVLLVGATCALIVAVRRPAGPSSNSKPVVSAAQTSAKGNENPDGGASQILPGTRIPWVGDITLPPGLYSPTNKIVVGGTDPDDIKKTTIRGNVISPPKTRFESGTLEVSLGSWKSDGNVLRNTSIAVNLNGRFEARNSILEHCTMRKAGAWIVNLYSSRWVFENCVISEGFINPWTTVDIGVSIRNCTFYDVNLTPIRYKVDAGKEVLDPPLTIRNCRFVHCTVPESFAIATRDCVFEGCKFGLPEPKLKIKTPVTTVLYTSDTNSLPESSPDRTFEIQDSHRAPQSAGATLRHHRSGSHYELDP